MSPAFNTRRQADEFDRLVEAARRGTPTTGPVSADLADLAAFASGLSQAPDVAPRAAFSADLRERLMTAAATELVASPDAVAERLTVRSNPAARRRRERRLTIGIASLAIVGASAGTALASQGSLPGEPLYPVKRAIENVRTGFTPSDQGKGAALLGDADTRLSEVSKLSRGSSSDDAEITRTLGTFTQQAKKASDLLLTNYQQHEDQASIAKLQKFTAASIDQLSVLAPLLPDSAKSALSEAAQAVLTIDTAAHNACPSCGGGVITSLPESLLDPAAQTLGAIAKAVTKAPAISATTTKSAQPSIKLPTVPTGTNADSGTLAPTGRPSTLPSPTAGPTPKSDPIKQLFPAKPTATPSTLGDVVKGVTDGLNGTLQGVAGTVDDVTKSLLGGATTK